MNDKTVLDSVSQICCLRTIKGLCEKHRSSIPSPDFITILTQEGLALGPWKGHFQKLPASFSAGAQAPAWRISKPWRLVHCPWPIFTVCLSVTNTTLDLTLLTVWAGNIYNHNASSVIIRKCSCSRGSECSCLPCRNTWTREVFIRQTHAVDLQRCIKGMFHKAFPLRLPGTIMILGGCPRLDLFNLGLKWRSTATFLPPPASPGWFTRFYDKHCLPPQPYAPFAHTAVAIFNQCIHIYSNLLGDSLVHLF